jgi:hypothetical protein
MHKQVTCKLWDREALEQPGLRKSSDGKRRLLAPEWTVKTPTRGPGTQNSERTSRNGEPCE